MTTWNPRANDLFLAARELPVGREREAFVRRACAGDVELRGDVLSLLAADQQAGSFLEAGAIAAADDRMPREAIEGPGDMVGPYKLLQEIGEGGMGIVFMAEQHRPVRRTVAIKILKPGMDARHVIARFESERQALALMDHPNITRVFDAGETLSGRPFFVMELVKGLQITDFCEERRLTIRQRLELMTAVCKAVQHAHQKGVIHRDLKPTNVMIALYDGLPVPKVIDFGVAKAVGARLTERTLFTEYGAILGTLEYMSPEQAELNQLDVDTRSDIYSLGVLMYELLTGTTPIERDRLKKSSLLDALRTIREEEPVKPSTRIAARFGASAGGNARGAVRGKLKSSVKGELDWVVMKALEKDRQRRYQTVGDLLRDIECFLENRPVHARPLGAVARSLRWYRRNRYVASLLVVVASLLVLLAVGATVSAMRLRREGKASAAAKQNAISAERLRRQELVGVYIAEANSASRPPGERMSGEAAIRGALAAIHWDGLSHQQQLDLINAAIPYLVSSKLRVRHEIPLSIARNGNPYHEIDVDPQLAWLATATDDAQATILASIDDPNQRKQLRYADDSLALSTSRRLFSPTGRWLLESRSASKGWRLLVWDASTGALVMNRVPHANYGFPAFDRDEEHLLLQDPDNRTLHKVEIETGRRIASSPPRFRAVQAAYSADGRLLAMISQSLFPEVVDAQTWSTVVSFPSIGRAASTAWHPREPWAAFGTYDGEIYRWRVGGSAKLQRLGRGHTDAVDLIVFSPDGRLLASSDAGQRFMVRRVEDHQVLASGPGCVLRFSLDSKRIAVRDASRLIVYEIEESHLYRQLNEVADAAEFSPSDRWLGVSGLCGARLFDARSLRLVADLGLDQCGPIAFHPHEAHLTTFGNFSQAWNWPWRNGELGPPESVGPVSLSKLSLAPQHRGRHAVWSADGTLLALADYRHNRVLLRNVLAKTDHEFTATRPVQVALSPDGKWLAANLAEASRAVVWNITNGDLHLDVAGGGGLNFSGDGKWFCLRTSNSVDLFSLPDFELRHSINLSTSHELSRIPPLFQPNGRLLATVDLAQRVQLINRETAQPIATLDDLDPSPVLWMSFSSDGRRLAVTRAERIAIWDLWELAAALQELGLKPRELTAPKRLTPFREADLATNIPVNRGVLPPADQWYVLWTLMARYEASQGNWPDAVDDMNRGWAQAPLNAADRAALLAERGSYLHRNLSYQAAIEDWEKSLELDFDEPTAILGLARLCVLGPQELRNPNRTQALAAILRAQGKAPQECSLLKAFALVQLGQARAKDVAALEHACLASREVLPLNWRLAAGYFLTLHQTQEGQADLAAVTLEETVSSHDDVQSELELDEQDELGRLKLETQAAVRKASSH